MANKRSGFNAPTIGVVKSKGTNVKRNRDGTVTLSAKKTGVTHKKR